MKKSLYVFFCLHLLWSGIASAQTLTAKVNRSEVPQGETFLLTLETDDDATSASPDLSVLEKDFNVYSVGNAYQSSYINGKTQHSRQWQIVLMPKNSGQIQVPSIKLGKMSSQPVMLNVISNALSQKDSNDNNQSFAVDAEVDNKSPYVQQQINYTFNIYDSGGLYGEAPVFMDSGNGDWIIKSLGEPSINTKVINGRQLREIQFKYALFPQKSGQLKTPDIEFQGYYLTQNKRNSRYFDDVFSSGFFNMGFSDMFATRNPVVLRPESISVDVKPVPAANGGYWWLPASQVVLSSEWEDKNPEFRVGEAVSRYVYLKAVGVIEAQLPDLKFATVDGMKQYPDKPIAMSTQQNGEIISIKKFGNVFIPEQEGRVTIPAISVDWYNIHTGRLEKAILPEMTVNILPAEGGNPSAAVADTTEMPKEKAIPALTENNKVQPQQPDKDNNIHDGQVLSMVVTAFVLGLIFSYILFGARGCRNHRVDAETYVRKIKMAVSGGNLKELRDNLLPWARWVYNDNSINNIDDILKHGSSSEFKTQLELLSQALYSGRNSKFNIDDFLRIFNAEQKRQKKRQSFCAPLPELYK